MSKEVLMTLKPGDNLPIPDTGPFSDIPYFILKSVKVKGVQHSTLYYPKSGSVPNTRHPNIRVIDVNWDGIRVLLEYSSTTGKVEVVETNVDEMTLVVRA